MNNQSKRVLLVITKSNFGGAQKYVFELAKSLSRNGFEVAVALGGNGVLIDKLKISQIPVFILPSLGRDISFFSDFKSGFELFKVIDQYKPDILHLNSSKIGAIGSIVGRMCLVPRIVFTIHGWAFNEERSVLSKILIKSIYSITIFFSHASLAVSQMTADQAKILPLYSLFQNKIKVVLNGIEIPNFISKTEARSFLSQKCNTDLSSKTIVGQIAELHPIKSIRTLITSAQALVSKYPNLVFLIIGDGEEKESLARLILELNLQDKVFLTGYIDNAAQYIKAFDIFTLTSKSEALALVLLEAGLAEVSVIASRVGGIPEIIEDKHTGQLFESSNSNELSAKIEYVLNMSSFEKEMILKNFHDKILDSFLIEHVTKNTTAHY